LKRFHLALIAAIPFAAATAHANSWNVAGDFSADSNPNGAWTYGYYLLNGALGLDLPPDPVTFISLTSSSAGSNYNSWFTPPEISVLNITSIKDQNFIILVAGFAPLTAFYAPVVRWTAPESGSYSIRADFKYSGLGAATTSISQAGLRINDTTLAHAYIGGPDGNLHIDEFLNLNSGQTLNFFIAKGQHSIGLNSTISAIPEPSSYLLFTLGIAAFRKRLLTIRSTGRIAAGGQSPTISF